MLTISQTVLSHPVLSQTHPSSRRNTLYTLPSFNLPAVADTLAM